MHVILLSFLTAFTLTYFTLPSIISIARAKRLFDEPNNRSSHTVSTPSLGGIGIFAGAIFSIVLWTPFTDFGQLQYILCAFIIIFLIGAKDDISPISPSKKLIGQVLAAGILVFKSDIQLTGFYGLFGIDHIPPFAAMVLSMFTILVIINAFNLIDGIDGLAGSIGALISGVLGVWFIIAERTELAIVAFATAGAVVAFLRYNYTPAKIFMGDTGSLLIGLVCSILIICFIDLNSQLDPAHPAVFSDIPAVAVGIVIVPLFDTLRVFITRLLRGNSPFRPDRRHIHHLLIDYGLSHLQATRALMYINILFIVFVFSLNRQLELHVLLIAEISIASLLTLYLHRQVLRKKNKEELVPAAPALREALNTSGS